MCKAKPPLVLDSGVEWVPLWKMVRDVQTGSGMYDVGMHGAPTICQYEGID